MLGAISQNANRRGLRRQNPSSLRVARDSPRAPLQLGGGRVCASRTRTLGGTNRPSRCSSTGYTPRCLPRRIERTSNPEDLGTNGWNEKRELTTVVLIHGLWMTPLSWEHWVARYQRQGLRVIAPGYPGIEPGLGQGRAQIQNRQERTALKPAKASAVAGSCAFRGFWGSVGILIGGQRYCSPRLPH